jgi:dTDP-4-amino-4,6-dideoxygalactose transaminase
MPEYIPLHSPDIGEKEREAVLSVLDSGELKGGGEFDRKCSDLIESAFDANDVLMTTSCTHALEMAAHLLEIDDSDEVIVPSYTFPSTATAFVLRGADIVFCDVDERTLTMDPNHLSKLVHESTAAIVPVHYAGSSCRMDKILAIADNYDVPVIEDAAQGVNAKYYEDYLGTIGDIGCYSFQGTKSYVAGEGGALLLNNERYTQRAEYLRQKGTNYDEFRRGNVDKYTWVDIGSSYVPSELQTALAYAQISRRDEIQSERVATYSYYQRKLRPLESDGLVQLPSIVEGSEPNYHTFYLILESKAERNALENHLSNTNISAAPHYEPLHLSKMGRSFGYEESDLPITEHIANCLLRLPVHSNINENERQHIVEQVTTFLRDS